MPRTVVIAFVLLVAFATRAVAQAQSDSAIFPQLGHASGVQAIAFSPDGTLVATASADHTIKLWDAHSLREVRTLTDNVNTVFAVAFSPDGKWLAAGGMDNKIRVWDVASGRLEHTMWGAGGMIRSIVFSPDSKMLVVGRAGFPPPLPLPEMTATGVAQPKASAPDASGDPGKSDNSTTVWEVASEREVRAICCVDTFQPTATLHTTNAIAISRDGTRLATGADDGKVKIWQLASGRLAATLSVTSGSVYAVALSPDGSLLAAGGADRLVRVWALGSGKLVRTLEGHTGPVRSVAFSPDGKQLASGGDDRTTRLWDVASGRSLSIASPHAAAIESVAFSPIEPVLASASRDGTYDLRDVGSGADRAPLAGHAVRVSAVSYASDGKLLATGDMDDTVKLWDPATGRLVRTLTGHTALVTDVAFSPDAKLLASASVYDSSIRIWDVASGQMLRTISGHPMGISFSPDGAMLASAELLDIKLWDVRSGQQIGELDAPAPRAGPMVVAWSPNGKLIASAGGADGIIRVWDAVSRKELTELGGDHPGNDVVGPIVALAFSPDSKSLASSDTGGEIKLWDAAYRQEPTPAQPAGDEVPVLPTQFASKGERLILYQPQKGSTAAQGPCDPCAIAFSPDGSTLASASPDESIRLWDVGTGQQKGKLVGHAGSIPGLAFSPDGASLASVSDDRTTRIWDMASGKMRAELVAFDDGSTIAATPAGFFESSSERAQDYMNVRTQGRAYAISSFRDEFLRPDIVGDALTGQPIAQYGDVGTLKLAPDIEIVRAVRSPSDSKLEVAVRVTPLAGGVGPLRIFLNDTAVLQDDNTQTLTRQYALPAAGAAATLRVDVYNADQSMFSPSAPFALAARVTGGKAERGTLHALFVGIQDFPADPALDLKYAVADAGLLKDALERGAEGLYASVDVRMLTSAAETSKKSIIEALKQMASATGPDDAFVLYIAGHGKATSGDYYVLTSDVSSDEASAVVAEALSQRQLIDLAANIPSIHKIILLDTCEAGAAADRLTQMTRGMSSADRARIVSEDIGLTMLMASASDEQAREDYHGHGVFTYVLADGLAGAAADPSTGLVSTDHLGRYVETQVPIASLAAFKTQQQPADSAAGDPFPLTKKLSEPSKSAAVE